MKKIYWIILISLCCFVLCLVGWFGITTTTIFISGNSMAPTLNHLDYGFTNKLNKTKVKRFDIIVFNQDDEVLIKRVIGLSNEHIRFDEGLLYIDGQVTSSPISGQFTSDFAFTTGKNELFVLGDNRILSYDSRHFGAVNLKKIIGKGFTHAGFCRTIEDGMCRGVSYKVPKKVK